MAQPVGGNHDARANREAIEASGAANVLDFEETEVIGLDVLAYEAEILYFDDDSLVAVDNIALRGTNGDFRVDRRLVDDEEVRESRTDEGDGSSDPARPVLPGVLGELQAADPGRRLWCPVPLA